VLSEREHGANLFAPSMCFHSVNTEQIYLMSLSHVQNSDCPEVDAATNDELGRLWKN
jgi:hypothetical protein